MRHTIYLMPLMPRLLWFVSRDISIAVMPRRCRRYLLIARHALLRLPLH